ncbi:cupin domain-containing protein [Schaalia vaccimaxillae]|uniref:cupin domain-containing protein n=1 Tax=Schaalia vaccimaxillae TaxID=183916 RepID=UPI0003B36A8B|nr:cupin domain-containing protein [Schaalia vaccimaxillae]
MSIADQLVTDLSLEPHPEGGWFRRTWTAPKQVMTEGGPRATASGILFLLDEDMEARWHVVRSDELWLWHGPGALEIHLGGEGEEPSAQPRVVVLNSPADSLDDQESATGLVPSETSNPVQLLVPADTWQRTFARGAHALATCVVSPEFTYDDWKLAENR